MLPTRNMRHSEVSLKQSQPKATSVNLNPQCPALPFIMAQTVLQTFGEPNQGIKFNEM